MSPGQQLTVADSLLKDVMKSDLPFGGKPILFAGNFRVQTDIVINPKRNDKWRHQVVDKI